MGARRPRFIVVLFALALAALLLYPLSFGPIYWVCSNSSGQLHVEQPAVQVLLELYSPLVWIYQEGPAPLRHALQWYLTFWGAP
ncbi:MAG: hypothetical protein U0836_14635 [Pirellulales bacterium]